MKNNMFKYSFAFVAILSFFACSKDYLEKAAIGSTSQVTLASYSGANALLTGAYSLLHGSGTVGGGWPSGRWIFGGVASDDAHTGTEAGALQPVPSFENYTVDPTNSSVNSKWRFLYSAIQRANDVLRVLPLIPAGGITADQATQLKAEAVFLRAYYHFEAAIMWKNIPYVDETVSFENGNFYVPNTDPVWSKIEQDFKFAADSLTATKADAGRVNSWAAKAFLVKTYMFQHKYNEAKPLLDDIIANGVTANGKKYALLEKFHDNWLPSQKNNAESVFAVQMSVNDGANGANGTTANGGGYMGPYGGPFPTYGFYQPSFSLVNSYKTDPGTGLPLLYNYNDFDITNDEGIPSSSPFTPYSGTLDPRLDWTVGRRGIPYLDWGVMPGISWVRQQSVAGPYLHIKSANVKAEPSASQGYSTAVNYLLIRFADVLLWAAEVEVELGNLAKAESYVNIVRARAANPEGWVYNYLDNNDPSQGYSTTPAANYKIGLYNGQFEALGQDFARESVRFERKLELAMEDHRFFDLQRYDNGSGYMTKVLNDYIKHETSIPGYNFTYMNGASFTQNKNEIYPIPQAQIDLSVKDGKATLTQNPGYQ
ncbi:MAG: RagB/SusD family nutrient uptake outer membrane protein [Sphingobacteriales bacterium]|nr:RagB/SusD family nutrient uptake outer membrane protein [Sphingobacteriales bacterium]OJY92500.1 MAG: RagB/SusD family nutrient uptake outer membrane protein [Sphingobacteriales bacterium 44-15]